MEHHSSNLLPIIHRDVSVLQAVSDRWAAPEKSYLGYMIRERSGEGQKERNEIQVSGESLSIYLALPLMIRSFVATSLRSSSRLPLATSIRTLATEGEKEKGFASYGGQATQPGTTDQPEKGEKPVQAYDSSDSDPEPEDSTQSTEKRQ